MTNIYTQRTLLMPKTGVRVVADSTFDPVNSNIKDSLFIWLYNIKVENYTADNIKVISGRWEIFDKYGKAELEDKALFNNPYIIKSGQSSQSTNIIRLFSDSGIIYGKYFFLNLHTKEEFFVDIETVSLDNRLEEKSWN